MIIGSLGEERARQFTEPEFQYTCYIVDIRSIAFNVQVDEITV
jgi:hypothetical protein